MKRIVGIAVGLSVIATLAFVAALPSTARSSEKSLFEYERFAGVSGVFLGTATPLRGIPGGKLPWVIAQGDAELNAQGDLEVEVRGLVIDPSNATAQALGIAGKNPAPFFFATLSCLGSTNTVTTTNTNAVPATATGNAEIEQTIPLPSTCFAPIVFVRGSFNGAPVGPWFAVSGF